MLCITFYSYGYNINLHPCDIHFNVASMGAVFGRCNNKIVSRIIREIYLFKKCTPQDSYIVGIQCLNGLHRSVEISNELCAYFKKYFITNVIHLSTNHVS